MRLSRIALLLACLLVASSLVACAKSEPERTWDSFLKAVAEKRADDAMQYIDFGRMVQKSMGQDSDAQAAMALLGGADGVEKLLQGLFRDAIASAESTKGASITKMTRPESAKIEGDYATLVFKAEGKPATVQLERIDGRWKIVDFGGAFGSEPQTSVAAKPTDDGPGGPGSYSIDERGTVTSVDLPASASDSLVKKIDDYRVAIGKKPVSYALVHIDNTKGSDQSYIDTIKVVTDDGAQVEYHDSASVISEWFINRPVDKLYDRGVTLSNSLLNKVQVLPGANSTTVFISSEQPSSIKSVWLDGKRMQKH